MPEMKTEFLFTIDLDFEIAVLGKTLAGANSRPAIILRREIGNSLEGVVVSRLEGPH